MNDIQFLKEKFTLSLKDKKEFLNSKDLIDLGLFKSFHDVCHAKKRGLAPPSIQLSERKIVYPKRALIGWLVNKMKEDDVVKIPEIKVCGLIHQEV